MVQAERVQAETDQVVNAAVVGPRALVRQLLKRQVVNRHWGEGQVSGVCWGGCSKNMVYDEVHLAHWRPRSELSEENGFVGATAQVSWLLAHIYCFHSKQVLTTACLLSALTHQPPQHMGAVQLPSCTS